MGWMIVAYNVGKPKVNVLMFYFFLTVNNFKKQTQPLHEKATADICIKQWRCTSSQMWLVENEHLNFVSEHICSQRNRTRRSTTSFPHHSGNNDPLRLFNESSYLWCLCVQMSRFLDMAEFGEAARYLRLTNLEQLAAKAQAFDGLCFLFIFLCTGGGKYWQSVLEYKKRN